MEKLREEVAEYIQQVREVVNTDLNNLQNYVNEEINRTQKQQQAQNGIIIDHKTFSDIINTLMVCAEQGVITNDLAFKLIEMGKAQTGKVVEQGSQPLKQEPVKQQEPAKEQKTPVNCDRNCMECKEPYAEKVRQQLAKDPIFQLLNMVREAASRKQSVS